MIVPTLSLLLLAAQGSHVEQVVVFPDRAQVTRAIAVPCAGRTTVSFDGIPPAAVAATFRASAKDAKVEGLRSWITTREQAFSQEISDLEAKDDALTNELRGLDDEGGRAQRQRQLGSQFEQVAGQLISRDLAVSKPDPKQWAQAFDAALNAGLEGARVSQDVVTRTRVLGWKREDVRAKLAELQGAAECQQQSAEVLVSCPAGRTATVKLTYAVGGASWTPSYEARADEPNGAVELGTWATVTQRTGEDWSAAHLLLSTAIPSQDATPPELQPLDVYAEERHEEKKVLVRREEQLRHAETGEGGEEPSVGMAAHAQGLSVQLEVPEAADVPGDGAPVRVFVGKSRMPAHFAWQTAPTLAPFVFRVADLTNRAPFPLLEGSLEAYGQSGLIGRYPLERVPRGGLFHLTFGVEDAVHVKRTVLQEVQADTGLFNDNRRFRYGYRFELANYGKHPTVVDLRDRIPVSELEDIHVEVDPGTSAGYRVKQPDGIVSWEVKLAPGQTQTFDLDFHVDVPKSYETGAL